MKSLFKKGLILVLFSMLASALFVGCGGSSSSSSPTSASVVSGSVSV